MIKKEIFGLNQDKDVFLFTLSNKSGKVLKLTNYGAKIVWIKVPDKEEKKDNITFGYDTFDETINGDPYFGSVVGRYANRIAHGEFSLDSVKYKLTLNNGVGRL